jgi:hypothetical protein
VRRSFGRLTYAVTAAQALRAYESLDCGLQYAGHQQRLRLVHLSVINASVFRCFLGIRGRAANLDDRILDVIAVEHLSRRRLLLAALQPVLDFAAWSAGCTGCVCALSTSTHPNTRHHLRLRSRRHASRRLRSRCRSPLRPHPDRLRRHRRLTEYACPPGTASSEQRGVAGVGVRQRLSIGQQPERGTPFIAEDSAIDR